FFRILRASAVTMDNGPGQRRQRMSALSCTRGQVRRTTLMTFGFPSDAHRTLSWTCAYTAPNWRLREIHERRRDLVAQAVNRSFRGRSGRADDALQPQCRPG